MSHRVVHEKIISGAQSEDVPSKTTGLPPEERKEFKRILVTMPSNYNDGWDRILIDMDDPDDTDSGVVKQRITITPIVHNYDFPQEPSCSVKLQTIPDRKSKEPSHSESSIQHGPEVKVYPKNSNMEETAQKEENAMLQNEEGVKTIQNNQIREPVEHSNGAKLENNNKHCTDLDDGQLQLVTTEPSDEKYNFQKRHPPESEEWGEELLSKDSESVQPASPKLRKRRKPRRKTTHWELFLNRLNAIFGNCENKEAEESKEAKQDESLNGENSSKSLLPKFLCPKTIYVKRNHYRLPSRRPRPKHNSKAMKKVLSNSNGSINSNTNTKEKMPPIEVLDVDESNKENISQSSNVEKKLEKTKKKQVLFDSGGSSNGVSNCSNMDSKPPLPPTALKNKLGLPARMENHFRISTVKTGVHPKHDICAGELDKRLSEVRLNLIRSREELALSHPDLHAMETMVRSSMIIDPYGRAEEQGLFRCHTGYRKIATTNNNTTTIGTTSAGTTTTTTAFLPSILDVQGNEIVSLREIPKRVCDDEWEIIVSKAIQSLKSCSILKNEKLPCVDNFASLEPGLDSGAPGCSQQSHPNGENEQKFPLNSVSYENPIYERSDWSGNQFNKARSLVSLQSPVKMASLAPRELAKSAEEKARSMEFLLDDSDKNAHLRPPENSLQKQERQPSEHELRIQRSLQKLNVPDWYKKHGSASTSTTPTGASKLGSFGSSSGLAGGWAGLSQSKTNSLTSLQSTGSGRYSGRTQYSRFRSTGTASAGGSGRSRDFLTSPMTTASASVSPSPYYDRGFSYGMPYALSRFATSRMSGGASPASLSPSPSPVGGKGSSTSTPVSGGPSVRYGSYSRQPYLGWRSQEKLDAKTLYRTPAERMAADLHSHKAKMKAASASTSSVESESKTEVLVQSSPNPKTASDLSLNNSDESSSNKLKRVRSSIKAVSNAIVDYVNESKPLDEGINGRSSPRKGFVWLESSFVGTKPIDSPGTTDTHSLLLSNRSGLSSGLEFGPKKSSLHPKFEDRGSKKREPASHHSPTRVNTTTHSSSYASRNEKMEERSSSSVSSPTLDDILDSLLALRPPQKKFKPRSKGHHTEAPVGEPIEPKVEAPIESKTYEAEKITTTEPVSIPTSDFPPPPLDWQDRMNQPVDDSAFIPEPENVLITSNNNNKNNNHSRREPESSTEMAIMMNEEDFNRSITQEPSSSQGASSEINIQSANKDVVLELEPISVPKHVDDEVVAKEENAFGTPTEIFPVGSNTHNESTPPPSARHRRVSFDLEASDKDERSSSRSKNKDEALGTIECRNAKCGKTATGLEARREFKTCHNCNAYYCSRECRRAHWEKHKKVCMQSRVGALCKQIISHIKEDSFVVSQLSQSAKRGYLAKGRGCVKLFFSSPDRAERFLTGGLPELPEPCYLPHGDILPEEMSAQTFGDLSDQCRSYNPETRFVLYASVCVVNEVPTSGAVKWEREMISRSAKIRLLLPRSYDENQVQHHAPSVSAVTSHHGASETSFPPPFHDITVSNVAADESAPVPSDGETLILRSVPVPASRKLSSIDHKRLREVSFANIQKHLIQRGVELRRSYPGIYSKLCNYVENDEPFLPVTIYPWNMKTGNQFVCIIMPESSDSAYSSKIHSTATENVETINISEMEASQ